MACERQLSKTCVSHVFINEDQNKTRRRNTPSVPWNNKAYHGPGPINFSKMSVASIKMSFSVNKSSVGKNVDHDDLFYQR
jgi:hypothetical protein